MNITKYYVQTKTITATATQQKPILGVVSIDFTCVSKDNYRLKKDASKPNKSAYNRIASLYLSA